MSADRELLEAAAKAAGYDHLVWTEGASPIIPGAFRPPNSKCYWNPLTDDGDAFRLLTKLSFTVEFYDGLEHVEVTSLYGDTPLAIEWYDQSSGRDKNAATRRAIVKAAAKLSKRST